MRASIDLPAEKRLYTNDDFIQINVLVKQDFEDLEPLEEIIDHVSLSLVCESKITINDIERLDVHYSSEPLLATLTTTNDEEKLAIYSGQLKFPCQASDGNNPLLGTIVLNDNGDGFYWSVRAKIHPKKSGKHSKILPLVEKPCQFVPTAQLPPLLDLMDTEHLEYIENTPISVVLTHAVAGLPQTPLTAGIGLRVACGKANKFSVSRIRLILKETTTVNHTNGFRNAKKAVAVNRWLLDDIHLEQSISLSWKPYILDHLVEDICIDFDTVHPSFETKYFSHNFELMAELTLEWRDQSGGLKTDKVTSISPVDVLPRIYGTKFKEFENSFDTYSCTSAEYTDSSDESSSLSDLDSDEGSISISHPYATEKGLFSVQELPVIRSVH